jgi:hypothetical protein
LLHINLKPTFLEKSILTIILEYLMNFIWKYD